LTPNEIRQCISLDTRRLGSIYHVCTVGSWRWQRLGLRILAFPTRRPAITPRKMFRPWSRLREEAIWSLRPPCATVKRKHFLPGRLSITIGCNSRRIPQPVSPFQMQLKIQVDQQAN
jgi:hypothetical protein